MGDKKGILKIIELIKDIFNVELIDTHVMREHHITWHTFKSSYDTLTLTENEYSSSFSLMFGFAGDSELVTKGKTEEVELDTLKRQFKLFKMNKRLSFSD